MNDINPPKDQDRVFDLYDTFCKYGTVMFRQQKAIYEQIARRLSTVNSVPSCSVLEFGCGNGVGTAILHQQCGMTRGTDISQRNINFASELYPWILFSQWDICKPWLGKKAEVVVSIEMLEHVADPQAAIKNMLDAAYKEVWISTPNGNGKPRPPSNPYHVREYTPIEMAEMIGKAILNGERFELKMYNWEDFCEIKETNTLVDPLVYRIVKK